MRMIGRALGGGGKPRGGKNRKQIGAEPALVQAEDLAPVITQDLAIAARPRAPRQEHRLLFKSEPSLINCGVGQILSPSGQDRETGLGDTTFTAFLSPAKPSRVIWGVGPVFLLPTASDDRLGADKWGLGPSAVLLTMPGNWVIGSLFSNVWSTGGSGDEDVSLFTWQFFANYNLPNGWYLTSSPIITANWEADSGSDTWTVPLGGGVGKIFRIGSLPPMNFQVQSFYNVAKPDAFGRWNLRVQLQLLFPKSR